MTILVLYAAVALALAAFGARLLAWRYHVRQIRRRRERRGGYLPLRVLSESGSVRGSSAVRPSAIRKDAGRPLSESSLDQDWTPKR